MKKILFGILTFLGIGLSFCSAGTYTGVLTTGYAFFPVSFSRDCLDSGHSYTFIGFGRDDVLIQAVSTNPRPNEYRLNFGDLGSGLPTTITPAQFGFCAFIGISRYSKTDGPSEFEFSVTSDLIIDSSSQGGGSSSSDIDIYYNNGNSVENITCDGTQAISIDGLSTITSTNTFTPYYNISYTDEDNQKLTESYSKDILYLENGQFKKTYTGNNDWILSVQGGSENSFSGYLPTFEITGGIEEVTESGNIFNNFAENSLKFTLSNIPSYIQYVILLFILFFILGFIRKFRRK